MKKILLLSFSLFFITGIYAQEYRKDTRTQLAKEDPSMRFKANPINNADLLRVLEQLGIHIYKFDIGKFDRKYNILLTMDEYVDGKKIATKEIMHWNNVYTYSIDSVNSGNSVLFYDYIDQLSFYIKQNNATAFIEITAYSGTGGVIVEEQRNREDQFYSCRYYTDTQWIFNEDVPLLVYASSWFDEGERFCGATVLSKNDEDTNKLLNSSPHYFSFSFKVTNQE